MTGKAQKRLISTLFALGVSSATLWWLLRDGAAQALVEALGDARPGPLLLAALLAVVIQIARAWRFAALTSGRPNWPSWAMIGIAIRLILFNFILPFKLGELSFPVMMKQTYGTPFGRGAGILLLCRLLDFGVVVAVLLLTAAYLLDPATVGWSPLIMAAVGGGALVAPLALTNGLPRLRRLTAPWPKIDHLTAQLTFGAAMMRPVAQQGLVAALTLSIWAGHIVIAGLTASAIGAGLDFLPVAMASAASNLAFGLPVSGVAGLGPPQAAWATMLHWTGVDWDPAITTALVCHGLLMTTIMLMGLATYLAMLLRPRTTVGTAKNHDRTRSP